MYLQHGSATAFLNWRAKTESMFFGVARRFNLHVVDMHTLFLHTQIPCRCFCFDGMPITMSWGTSWLAMK